MRQRLLLIFFAILVFLSGCGGGGPSTPPPPPAITVSVAPATATVQTGSTAQFTATVSNTTNVAVTWTLSGTGCTGAACGTLSSATANPVTYTAPSPPASNLTVTITATSAADTTKSGSATITVPAVTVSVAPPSATVLAGSPGNTQQFTATVSNTTNLAVTWTLSGTGCTGSACGTLSSTTANPVTYTAPSPPASNLTVTITATSAADTSKSGSATITVPAITVAVAPTTASVPVRGTQNFTATVSNGAGAQSVTWTLRQGGTACSPGCGTIAPATTPSGTPTTYSAPVTVPTPATVTVTATSVTDTTKSASATATVVGITVSVSPTSASVVVNATQQFIATVMNDVSSSGVTWTLTQSGTPCSPTCGTIAPTSTASGTPTTYTAPATVPTPATVTVTATSVADTSKSASAIVTVTPPPPISVSVAPTTASVAVNSTRPFTATVTNDPASRGVTWTVSGAGCTGSTCGTVAPTSTASGTPTTYTAPAVVPSPATVTITATSVTDPTKSGSATITVTVAGVNNAELNGQYAFWFTGFDAGGSMAMAGSFIADGAGGLKSGLQDVNRTSGVTMSQAFTGTYTVGADNRGSMTLTATVGGTPLGTFRFALGSFNATNVATKARFIEFDTSGTRGSGVIEMQNPAAFSTAAISGGYALGLSGVNNSGLRFGLAGRFTADGAGGITSGEVDTDTRIPGGGAVASNGVFAGTYSVAGTGRGTVTITSGSTVGPFSFYVVSATELFAISTAPQSTSGLSSGQILQQSGGPFINASLSSPSVIGLNGLSPLGNADIIVGVLFPSGTGNFTATDDESFLGTISGPFADFGTYSVAANGRATIQFGSIVLNVVGYLVAPNKGFIVGQDRSITTGFFEPQSGGPFNNASVSGNLSFGTTTPVNTGVPDQSGVLTFNNGSVMGTFDSSQTSGLFPDQAFASTYNVTANGRATIPATGTAANVFYIVSPSKFILTDSSTQSSVSIFEK